MERLLISPDRIPEWIPGTTTLDSSGCNWNGITLKGYRYERQDAAIPPMRDYMIVGDRSKCWGHAALRSGGFGFSRLAT